MKRKTCLTREFSWVGSHLLAGVVLCAALAAPAWAQPVQGGVPAQLAALEALVAQLADEVAALKDTNEALEAQVAELSDDFAALEAVNLALETRLADVENNAALELGPYVSVNTGTMNALAGPHVIFSDVNVHVRDGSGTTAGTTGLGNLVLGYNEMPSGYAPGERSGAHNFVVGRQHRYSSFGGIVAGFGNTISGNEASVTGGYWNAATGDRAAVSGGLLNQATGEMASVSGGAQNQATGSFAAVSGGSLSTASGAASAVNGGVVNSATATYATVNGGSENVASGGASSVSGGTQNEATGGVATVSGGQGHTASGFAQLAP